MNAPAPNENHRVIPFPGSNYNQIRISNDVCNGCWADPEDKRIDYDDTRALLRRSTALLQHVQTTIRTASGVSTDCLVETVKIARIKEPRGYAVVRIQDGSDSAFSIKTASLMRAEREGQHSLRFGEC